MLKFVLYGKNGQAADLYQPLKASFEASDSAPADCLTAVFAVDGRIPVLTEAELWDGDVCVLRGIVDQQTEEQGSAGILLTVTVRSLAALLLDNEALPQTYCMPSMSLLMKRHFAPLGFSSFVGEDVIFPGEMTVSKGMSEWTVLKEYCSLAGLPRARIRPDGVIDLSGSSPGTVMLSGRRILRLQHRRSNRELISEVCARTCTQGGYDMKLSSSLADACGVRRRRYANSIDSKSRSVLADEARLRQAEDNYELLTVDYSGRLLCEIGTELIVEGVSGQFVLRELNYRLDSGGERTVLRAGRKREEQK